MSDFVFNIAVGVVILFCIAVFAAASNNAAESMSECLADGYKKYECESIVFGKY